MKLWKTALLLLSSVGLYSVANYSAEVATVRPRKRIFQDDQFWVIAHRGFSGRFPENTMLAFEQAVALPIDAIELDVHTSRDGRIVVMHDATLDRTTDMNGQILNHNWEELKKADAGYHFDPDGKGEFPFRSKGIGIPLLEEVFKKFPQMKFVIEIKQTMPALEEILYRLIRKYKMEDKVIVASEHYEPLARFRHLQPIVATNLSKQEARDFYQMFQLHLSSFQRCRGDALQIPEHYRNEPVVTPKFVESARRKGLVVHIWTVNDPSDMKRLIEYGVDGIISDFPDRLLRVVAVRP